MPVESVHLLPLGRLTAPRSVLHENAGEGTVTLPVPAFLITSGPRRIVVDCGMSAQAAEDPGAAWGGLAKLFEPHIGPQDTLAARLGTLDLRPGDITDLVFTHLHFDHAGGAAQLPGARRWVQRIEYRNALHPERHYRGGYVPREFAAGDYELLDGDATVAPGVHVLFTPGHTHGHQSVLVRAGERWLCLTGDVADGRQILDDRLMPGVCVDPGDAMRSQARLRLLETALGAELIFSHDDEQHAALPRPPEAIAG